MAANDTPVTLESIKAEFGPFWDVRERDGILIVRCQLRSRGVTEFGGSIATVEPGVKSAAERAANLKRSIATILTNAILGQEDVFVGYNGQDGSTRTRL